ncbi:MAG: hypothetical protein M5U14_07025 [Acidimicrobiia bacterium]|nr:hypothetical protein [Acidimicrobiia bacterium]
MPTSSRTSTFRATTEAYAGVQGWTPAPCGRTIARYFYRRKGAHHEHHVGTGHRSDGDDRSARGASRRGPGGDPGITAASPALIQAVYRAWKALRDVDRLGETIAEQARAASGDDLGDATNVEDVVGAMVRSMADAVALHDIATSILRHLLEAVESRTWPEYLGVAAEIHATA